MFDGSLMGPVASNIFHVGRAGCLVFCPCCLELGSRLVLSCRFGLPDKKFPNEQPCKDALTSTNQPTSSCHSGSLSHTCSLLCTQCCRDTWLTTC